MFICFSCGETGNVVDMVMRVTNRTYFEAMRLVLSKHTDTDFEKQIDYTIDKPSSIEPFDMGLIKNLNANLLSNARAQEYFFGRGINLAAQEELLLGYSQKQDMVIVPVFDVEGVCAGFVGRSLEGKSFKNSTGLPKSKLLYNLNRCKRSRVAVVESSFDAIRLWQLNIPAVATLGASVSKNQIHLLQAFSSGIIVCPDNDEAGKQLENKILKNISNKSIDVIRLNKGKDIGDLSDEEIVNVFNSYSNKLVLSV